MGMREQRKVEARLDDELRARLYRYAHRSGRSVQWLIGTAVRRLLDEAERTDTLLAPEVP